MVLAEDDRARTTADTTERAIRVLVRVPSVCAAVAGVRQPSPDDSYAKRALEALGAKRSDPPAVRALEVLLNLESEHGFSASTFACRVAASSGANAGPCLAAATATLSGERHGGATAHARDLLEQAHASGDIAAFVRERFARKARLAGFGHRIYKVADPRVPPLRAAMHAMGNVRLLAAAEALEREAAPIYGAKGVHANIDLFGAALLDGLGVAPDAYVAAFALGIACGWLAHWAEQRATGRLIRPDCAYTGPAERALPSRKI
jgi:citrate synthase